MATTVHEPSRMDGLQQADFSGNGRTPLPAGGEARILLERSPQPAKTGMWVALAAITMSFAALTSALVVRQGTAMDWRHLDIPPVLYFNTLLLMASSVTLEIARKRIAAYTRGIANEIQTPMRWLLATLALGLLFVAGQYAAWIGLKSEGLYLATNPNSSFFYLFTGVHAVHVLGGLWGLVYIISKFKRGVLQRSTFAAAAQYWHFMDLLWIYLLLVLWVKL